MTNSRRIATFIFLLLSFAGCKKETSVENVPSPLSVPLMPLTIGNMWIVKGTSADTLHPGIIFDTVKVEKDTVVNGETWLFVTSPGFFGRKMMWLANRSDGLYQFRSYSSPQISLWLKYPAERGVIYDYFGLPITVSSTADTIQIPAGRFACYHYSDAFDEYWYSPNKGLAKYEEYIFSGGRVKLATYEVLSYRLN